MSQAAAAADTKKSFTCVECGKAFNSIWYLKQHAVKHSKDRPFTCKYCSRTYRFRSNLYQHKCPQRDLASGQNHKSSVRSKKMQRKSTSAGDEAKQQATANASCVRNGGGCLPPADTITRPLGAAALQTTSINGQLCMLGADMAPQHNYAEPPLFYKEVVVGPTTEATHKCHRCYMVFPNQEYLTRHLSWHNAEERKLQCSRCSEVFENELLHDAHQQLHAVNAVHGCTFCMGKFCHRLALKRHMIRCGAQRTAAAGWLFANGADGDAGGQFSPPKIDRLPVYNEYDMNSVASSSGTSHSCPDSSEQCSRMFAVDLEAPAGSAVPSLYSDASATYASYSLEDGCGKAAAQSSSGESEENWYHFDQSFVQNAVHTWNAAGAYNNSNNNGHWQYVDDGVTNGQLEIKMDQFMNTAAYGYSNGTVVAPEMIVCHNATSLAEQQSIAAGVCQQQEQLHFNNHRQNSNTSATEAYRNYATNSVPLNHSDYSCSSGSYGIVAEELSCSTCSLLFDTSEQLHDHFITVHVLEDFATGQNAAFANNSERGSDWELPPTLCSICGGSFDGEEALRSHILSDHRPDKRFGCHLCGQMFNRRQNLKKHASTCMAMSSSSSNNNNGIEASSEQYAKVATARTTNKTAVTTTTTKTELKCRHCSKVFIVKRNLKQHESSHQKPPEGDDKCCKQQTDEATEAIVLSCPLCPKTFSVARLLKQHVSFHARANSL